MTASNPNIINGLQPVQGLLNAVWRNNLRPYYVVAGTTSALYVGDPVIKLAASADQNGINGVALASAGATDIITGVVCGIIGTCPTTTANADLSNVSLYGTKPGPAYVPATPTGDWYVLVDDDPNTEWFVMSDNNYGGSSGTPVPPAAVGKNINLHSGTGSILGWSGWYANSDSIAATDTYQCNILGLYSDPQNIIGNLNQRLIVRLNTASELQQNSTGI